MRQTAVDGLINHLKEMYHLTQETLYEFEQAKELDKQQKMNAYQHGRDDENCALSDGAMAPDYDNAEEWYQGEYWGEQ